MPEWENWFEIAKQCKYLPENDLKARHDSVNDYSQPVLIILYVCLEIMSDRMRFVDRRSQHPASQHPSYSLRRHPWTSKYNDACVEISLLTMPVVSLVLRFRRTV